MPTPEKLNPELVLKAAQMVRPDIDWQIYRGADWFVVAMDDELNGQFDPLHDDSAAWALCEKLENMGWVFSCIGATYNTPEGVRKFWNCDLGGRATNGHRTKKIALLAALSNSTGTPLYLPMRGLELYAGE